MPLCSVVQERFVILHGGVQEGLTIDAAVVSRTMGIHVVPVCTIVIKKVFLSFIAVLNGCPYQWQT